MEYYAPNSELKQVPKIINSMLWMTDSRPLPEFGLFPEEILLEVAGWCLDPTSLLNLSCVSKKFSSALRVSEVWISHHYWRGFDIEILAKKAARAADAEQYGPGGWGILLKSAFDKAEFPDDTHTTQWNMGKPLPHLETASKYDPDAIEKYQPRGEKWMRVIYDIITEHTRYNLGSERYSYIHDEALKIRVKSIQGRYFQALICSVDILIRMFTVDIAVLNTNPSYILSWRSLDELPVHDERRTSLTSLTETWLIAKKIMESNLYDPQAQLQRRLYPHRPIMPEIWEGSGGDIDPKGLGWLRKVMDDWKGRVYVVGQFAILHPSSECPFTKLKLARSPFRMCLDFDPNGQITGRGSDFEGKFNIVSGSYRKTFVELVKQYEDDDDPDIYHAYGHMTPWGVFGSWFRPEDPKKLAGYWVMWLYEGAPVIQQNVSFIHKNGRIAKSKQQAYKAVPGWFEEYERLRDRGEWMEKLHGYFEDPPPAPEDVPLPEIDAFGL